MNGNPAQNRKRLLPCLTGLFIAVAPFGAIAAAADRYQLHGDGVLSVDSPLQRGDTLSLRATLTPTVNATADQVPLKSAQFALSAQVSNAQLVCYNDTIFRDDFDGDGD